MVDLSKGSNRSFGLILALFFAVVGSWPLLRRQTPHLLALTASAILFVIAVFCPKILQPVNNLWTRIGRLIQTVTNPFLMGLLFFGGFVPLALLLRIRGKELLALKFDSNATTYWKKRELDGTPDSMTHQF